MSDKEQDNQENEKKKFRNYSEDSNEITLYYRLVKHNSEIKEWTNISLYAYKQQFGSQIKKNFDGYETFNKSDTLYEIKKKVSEKTGFPIETIIKFGTYSGKKYGPDEKLYNMVTNYDVDDKTMIMNSHYNNTNVENRYVYLYIDPSGSKIFESINKNQIINDKKQKIMENDICILKKDNAEKNKIIFDLKNENEIHRNQLNDLSKKNENLRKKQEEEEKIKNQKKKDIIDCENKFNENKSNIMRNKINDSKKEINKIIINKYAKEFKTEEGSKSSFTNSLINFMINFTKEFMKFNEVFIESFKQNSEKIIREYDTDKNSISIEHINFIVIGSAGVGKSAFINESLLLENNKAQEGKGESVTNKSKLYISDKLIMIRMWDTPGIDFKLSPDNILKEIENIVNNGLKKGPDHFINIILYCTKGDRFQEEEGKLIYKIMQLYPSDDLPVIITQLQSYFEDDVPEMEKEIRNILYKYLDKNIVDKIEIKDVVSRDKINKKTIIKARGIPKLLRCSFDIMGRSITSATFKKFSEDIENLCREYVDKKLNYVQNIFKDENELFEITNYLINEEDDYFEDNENKKLISKKLSFKNIYKNKNGKTYFSDNFISILSSKILDIYKNLNNISKLNDKPAVFYFLEEKIKMIKGILDVISKKVFETIYKSKFQDYFNDLQLQQNELNQKYKTNVQIFNAKEIKEEFIKELSEFFNNEFFKIFLCIIIYLFKNNLRNNLIENYKKYLDENKKIISQKAEISLKNVTIKLKNKLLNELDKYFPKEVSIIERKSTESSSKSLTFNLNKLNDEIVFPEYI